MKVSVASATSGSGVVLRVSAWGLGKATSIVSSSKGLIVSPTGSATAVRMKAASFHLAAARHPCAGAQNGAVGQQLCS
jgi:hypothetical protein